MGGDAALCIGGGRVKITRIGYSALINLGNYNNERIELHAQIDESETVPEVVEALRQKIREVGGRNADEMYNTLERGKRQLASLEQKIALATEKWNATAEFLRRQGIKPDANDMPQFTNLLPSVSEELVEEAEIEEEDPTF